MTIHTGFLSLILTLEDRAGALGQPSEDCIGEVYCCLRQKRFTFRASLSRVLCAWTSCLRGLCLVGSPTLSSEAEEPAGLKAEVWGWGDQAAPKEGMSAPAICPPGLLVPIFKLEFRRERGRDL